MNPPKKTLSDAKDRLRYEIDNLAQGGPGTNPAGLCEAIERYVEVAVMNGIWHSEWDHAHLTRIGSPKE